MLCCRIKKHQKLRRGNRLRRLQMCGRLAVRCPINH